MTNNECVETILDDIVRVDIYKASQSNVGVPRSIILHEVSLDAPFTGDPSLTLALNGDGMRMQSVPTLKVSNGRQQSGNIYTHDLQANTNLSRKDILPVVDALQGVDCHILYTHVDGSRSLTYSLPNAFTIDVDESLNGNTTVTVKVKALSMSGLIDVVNPE